MILARTVGTSYGPGMGTRADLERFNTISFVRIQAGGAQYNGLPNSSDGFAGSFCRQCGVMLHILLKSHVKAVPTSRTNHSGRRESHYIFALGDLSLSNGLPRIGDTSPVLNSGDAVLTRSEETEMLGETAGGGITLVSDWI